VRIPPPPPKAYLQTVPLLVKVSTAGRSMLLMGVNSFDRAMSREDGRSGNVKAVGLRLLGQRNKTLNANDERFALAA